MMCVTVLQSQPSVSIPTLTMQRTSRPGVSLMHDFRVNNDRVGRAVIVEVLDLHWRDAGGCFVVSQPLVHHVCQLSVLADQDENRPTRVIPALRPFFAVVFPQRAQHCDGMMRLFQSIRWLL